MADLLPWLTPDDTIEALEILQAAAECMRNTSEFGSLRKELRLKLEQQAASCEEFIQRAKHGAVDSAVMLAVDDVAREKKTKVIVQITEALESFISAHNRRNSK